MTRDNGDNQAPSHLPPGIAKALAHHPVEDVLATVLMRLRHLEEALVELRTLVPEAFKEGFASRVPDTQEPWLADWLTSETRGRLEALIPPQRPAARTPPPTIEDA